MDNIVMARFGEEPAGFVEHKGNKTPVYRDENSRPYILINLKESCEGIPGGTKWTTVKKYVDIGPAPDPQVTQQYQNPIYGE